MKSIEEIGLQVGGMQPLPARRSSMLGSPLLRLAASWSTFPVAVCFREALLTLLEGGHQHRIAGQSVKPGCPTPGPLDTDTLRWGVARRAGANRCAGGGGQLLGLLRLPQVSRGASAWAEHCGQHGAQ